MLQPAVLQTTARSHQKSSRLVNLLVSGTCFFYNDTETFRIHFAEGKISDSFHLLRDRRGVKLALIRIGICDDEQALLAQLEDWVREILERHSIKYHIESYINGSALLARDAFDILLLDIEMEPLGGLELAKKLRMRGDESKLIFITAYEQYALEAYDVQAFHYLVKPAVPEKLEKVLLKVCSSLEKEYKRGIAIRQGTGIRRIPLEQILYLEVLDRKIYLHTEAEATPFYGKLEELEPTLPETFFRCHRSYIVNFAHVQRYSKGDVMLDNEENIPLSKRRYKAFGLAFMNYLKESGDVF